MKCPRCAGKLVKGNFHYAKCYKDISDRTKVKELNLNYNLTHILDRGVEIQKDYLESEFSIADLTNKYKLSANHMRYVLKTLGIPQRNIKTACNTDRNKTKKVNTCINRYGAVNVLSKNTVKYHKRNNTVSQRYGVSNVRQLESVKQKINKTMMQKYGKLRISTFKGYSINKMNKFESLIANILVDNHIPFTFSKYIGRKQYDFKILDTRILIEAQGDFWHANPKFYKKDDILKMPSGKKYTAQEIWDKDEYKKELALRHNYNIIYIWESDKNNAESIILSALGID